MQLCGSGYWDGGRAESRETAGGEMYPGGFVLHCRLPEFLTGCCSFVIDFSTKNPVSFKPSLNLLGFNVQPEVLFQLL